MACSWQKNSLGEYKYVCKSGDETGSTVPKPPPNSNSPAWAWPTTQPGSEHITGYYGSQYRNASGGTYAHNGIDIGIPVGNSVLAPHAGTAYTREDPNGYGHYVQIVGNDGLSVILGHLSAFKIPNGTQVNVGDVVGLSGSSGNSTGPHIHFEVRSSGGTIDPFKYLGGSPKPGVAGNPGTAPVNPADLITVSPDRNGVLKPTEQTDPLARMAWKQADGSYALATDAPSKCTTLLPDFQAAKNCYLEAMAKKAAGVAVSGAAGTVGSDILANIIPASPEERKAYLTRWLVGIVGVIIVFIGAMTIVKPNSSVILNTVLPGSAGKVTKAITG